MKNLKNIDSQMIWKMLDDRGYAIAPRVLTPEDCRGIIDLYDNEKRFRSTINMQRYRFGKGEYKYLNYPLPPVINSLRETFYKTLVPIANQWMDALEIPIQYPESHKEFISRCHAKDQTRPTPLILRYGAGGYNTLHQDMYGEIYFPLQVVLMLTTRGKNYDGGELVFVEQLPRAQSRAEVVTPALGDAVIFTSNFRPVKGSRGYYRAKIKHGISPVRNGQRFALGIIFHDAI